MVQYQLSPNSVMVRMGICAMQASRKAFIFTVKEAEEKEDEINEIKMSENFPVFFSSVKIGES